jgi:hypothetical protein
MGFYLFSNSNSSIPCFGFPRNSGVVQKYYRGSIVFSMSKKYFSTINQYLKIKGD